jgi:hypothetical protein
MFYGLCCALFTYKKSNESHSCHSLEWVCVKVPVPVLLVESVPESGGNVSILF